MSNRSWFFASQGKQQGPYPEAQLREFIANGTLTAETLVWSEGMAGWQKAGDIPGLLAGASGPPVVLQAAGPLTAAPLAGRFRPTSEFGSLLGGVWCSGSDLCSSSLCRGCWSCTAGGSFPARAFHSGQILPSPVGR